MKKFYGRELELERLKEMMRQSFNDHSRFTIIVGRRRIGKTSLVTHLIQEIEDEVPSLYFFVGKKTEATLLDIFRKEIRSKLGEFVPDGITTFRELFELLLNIAKRQKFILFIDEFQEYDNINPDVFSDMQELWDKYRHDTKMCLIVSGSIYRTMEKIFKDKSQPLFGRDDATIKLDPFPTNVLCEILHDYNADYTNDDLLALWTITGGVAKYVEILMNNHCTTMRKMMRHICTSGDNYFINEGKTILIEEFGKSYNVYFSILDMISQGEVSQKQIEAGVGIKNISGHLKLLEEEYKVIRKKRPIGAGPNSQTVRYEITDNFFRFWFRYIQHYSYLLEIQNFPALQEIMISDYPTFSGIALERWFRKRLMESCKYKQIGGWWLEKRKKSSENPPLNTPYNPCEIEIVAERLTGEVEVYEVKRNKDKYRQKILEEKISEMQKQVFRGKLIQATCLSMEDMERIFQ